MLSSRYTYDQRYDRALEIYLRLRHKDVYQLIHKHNLFSSIEDKIVLLMDFDKEVIDSQQVLFLHSCVTLSSKIVNLCTLFSLTVYYPPV